MKRRGQSLVLAAVACLGLALGVLATVQMGRAVHQRIHVQNVADASAYSVAAAQARAYNFWAFSNRAQITHYNAMMGLQAYASYLSFMPYALASLSDSVYEASSRVVSFSCCLILHGGYGCCCVITTSGIRDCVPGLCDAALQARDAMEQMRMGFEQMHEFAQTMDPVLANLRRSVEVANRSLVPAANAAMFQSAQDFIGQGRRRLVRDMDDEVNAEPVAQGIDFLLDRMNKAAFVATVEPTAMALAPRANNGEESRRIMAELANASRYNELVTNRRARGLFEIDQLGLIFGGSTSGQTKLISNGRVSNNARNPVPEITAERFDESIAPVGDYLASEDTFRYSVPWWNFLIVFPRSTGSFGTYVVAGPDGRKRKTWSPNPSWRACPRGIYRTSARRGNNYETPDDGPAFDGIAPYMRFAARAESELDFGQPSVYTFANKAARHIDRDGESGPALQFRLDTADRQNVTFNSRIGAEQGLLGQLTGVNAIARAMTYYHRPGNWAEHPNFFNPFWRAKLAPIGQRFVGNPLAGLLGGQIGDFMAENFMTH